MKALILAAGRGKRLRPYTERTPKALFPIFGHPLLDRSIRRLIQAGCREIIINTHHLARDIDMFLRKQAYEVPVSTRYEPELLDTGGAIKNVADFWDDEPFVVINCDIVTDIDLRAVYDFHLSHPHPVSLVLHDDPDFNTVLVDSNAFVCEFGDSETPSSTGGQYLTFTGIQVLDPQVVQLIPENRPSSSIDTYRRLLADCQKIKAYATGRIGDRYWIDIGTPLRYRQAVYDAMAPEAFRQAFADDDGSPIESKRLKGDGSDRTWYRLTSGSRSLIMADHGIRMHPSVSEVDSFIAIGDHLRGKKIPVPELLSYDPFSGLVFLEDLGNTNLQMLVRQTTDPDAIGGHYRTVIHHLIRMSRLGAKGFDPAWTYQGPRYDRTLIIDRECRYFVEAFLDGYLGWKTGFDDLKDEFGLLADRTLEFSVDGFMHRDFQSRNIMVKNDSVYFIDFQGGRLGPLQYDLASLLIDPYVNLPYHLQTQLLHDSITMLSTAGYRNVNADAFRRSYTHCCLTRNLQMLGAFGYLSRVKGKTYFEQYIPPAIKTLKRTFTVLGSPEFPRLKNILDRL